MRIDSSGNVGIGTTSPNYNLEIQGTQPIFSLKRSGGIWNDLSLGDIIWRSLDNDVGSVEETTGQLSLIAGSTWGGPGTHPTDMAFSTQLGSTLSERMRITSTGNVGIGTTGPGDLLQVQNNVTNDLGGITKKC